MCSGQLVQPELGLAGRGLGRAVSCCSVSGPRASPPVQLSVASEQRPRSPPSTPLATVGAQSLAQGSGWESDFPQASLPVPQSGPEQTPQPLRSSFPHPHAMMKQRVLVKALPLRLLASPPQAVSGRGAGHFQATVLYTEGREQAGDQLLQMGTWPGGAEGSPFVRLRRQEEIIKLLQPPRQEAGMRVALGGSPISCPREGRHVTGPPFSQMPGGGEEAGSSCRSSGKRVGSLAPGCSLESWHSSSVRCAEPHSTGPECWTGLPLSGLPPPCSNLCLLGHQDRQGFPCPPRCLRAWAAVRVAAG